MFTCKTHVSQDGSNTIICVREATKKIRETVYLLNEKVHRKNGPAFVREIYDAAQDRWITRNEIWCEFGEIHHVGAPAIIFYFSNGQPKHQKWYVEGALVYEITRYETGAKRSETYHMRKSSDKEPTRTLYRPTGELFAQQWLKNGKLHRPSGFAHIQYDIYGAVECKKIFNNGVECPVVIKGTVRKIAKTELHFEDYFCDNPNNCGHKCG